MEPKAKWSEVFVATGEWSAEVGPFTLEIGRNLGRCEIWLHGHPAALWSRTVSTPCDVADLMRLAEAELARRLMGAAETMDGSELAAPERGGGWAVSGLLFPPNPTSVEQRTEHSRFKAGNLVRDKYDRRVAIVQKVVDDGACHLESGYFHACALEPYALPPVASYADLANVLDELPAGTIVEVTSARGVALFRRDAPESYRCQHLSEDKAAWLHATALTCLREKLLPMPNEIRVLPSAEVLT